MTTVAVVNKQLVVRVLGLDVLTSPKREIGVNLDNVDGVASASREQPQLPAIRAGGLSIPGYQSGTFVGNEGPEFWDVQADGARAIVIYIRGDVPYQKLVVDVEDPDDAIRTILGASATPRD